MHHKTLSLRLCRNAAGPETLATGVAGKIGGKSWSFGCDRARGDAQSQERCQMAQAAPQSGAHLRGRERDAVGSARAIASGKGFNDVVGARVRRLLITARLQGTIL